MRAKQTREPFPLLNKRSASLFEIVHVYVWGPYGEESVRNIRFVLTLVEDHSRMIWTYLISSKDLVCSVLDTFIWSRHNSKRILNASELIMDQNSSTGMLVPYLTAWYYTSGNLCLYSSTECSGGEEAQDTLGVSSCSDVQGPLPLKFWPYSILIVT